TPTIREKTHRCTSPPAPALSVDSELAREAEIRVHRARDGLPGPIVADTVRPGRSGTGNRPLHGIVRAGEAVISRPRVRRLPVPVIGHYRPYASGVLQLDLQKAILDAQIILWMPTPENDSDRLPAAVRRVGIGDDTAKALVRGLIVRHHAGLYGDLA